MLVALAQIPVFGQYMAKSYRNGAPIVAEESIRNIFVTDNIDVLLIEDKPERAGVKVSSTAVEKLRVRVDGESLYLSTEKNVAEDERVHVFVTVSDLHRLELSGNSYATTKGILHARNLSVVLKENARTALRSKGEVLVTTPADYRITKNKEFYSVYAVSSL